MMNMGQDIYECNYQKRDKSTNVGGILRKKMILFCGQLFGKL